MGAGASAQYEYTGDDKAKIVRAVDSALEDLKKKNVDEIELFEGIKDTYIKASKSVVEESMKANDQENSEPQTLTATKSKTTEDIEDDFDSNAFNLKGSVIYQPFSEGNSISNLKEFKTGGGSEPPGKLINAKTSSQLLSMVNEDVADDQEKIAQFISQLKLGEVPTVSTSSFRQRRLTYTQKTVDESVPSSARDSSGKAANANNEGNASSAKEPMGSPAASTPGNPASASSPPFTSPIRRSTHRAVRTTIFASSEIGYVQEKAPPFPDEILGTYSCHGIEPSYDTEDGIHEKINQDRGCVVYPYHSSKNEALFIVLDGHGETGDHVSEFVMRQIVVSLEKDPLLDTDPIAALKSAFVTTNTALLVTQIPCMTSGCTCVAVYMKRRTMYVANVGDSRAVMAYQDSNNPDACLARDLSRDHKPDDPEEMARIKQWGGYVCPPHEEGLSARVYLDPGFTMIGLAMARSIGDHAAKAVGVIPEPEVKVFELQESDQFMIMASDGVWEFITSQEAVDIVKANLHLGTHDACQILIETAAQRWQDEEGDYRDDITAIIVRFPLPFN